jgi:hypothetical protein
MTAASSATPTAARIVIAAPSAMTQVATTTAADRRARPWRVGTYGRTASTVTPARIGSANVPGPGQDRRATARAAKAKPVTITAVPMATPRCRADPSGNTKSRPRPSAALIVTSGRSHRVAPLPSGTRVGPSRAP